MKNILFASAFLFSAFTINAQSFARLDINHFNAGFNAAGDQLSQPPNFTNNVITPYNQLTFTIGNLWIGGYDTNGQLHVAAQTYRQTGTDFWAGPMDTVNAVCSATQNANYNKVWKINKTTIDSFRLGLFSVIPNSITSWPGNGNVAAGESRNLAPYVDVDGDGTYNYAAGDYPKIRGDQALWFVYNDSLSGNGHSETTGRRLGVEIRCLAYAVACGDSALSNTIFMHYDIINRSNMNYDSTIVGLWTDLDAGPTYNNNIGSDSLQNNFYYYSDYFAAGAVFLNQSVAKTISYNNDFTITGNPVLPSEYYGYMLSNWKDGSPMTYGGNGYGGTNATPFAYTGNPFSGNGWLSGTPTDRKMMGSTTPFTFFSGMDYSIDMAYVAAYDPSATTNLCVPNLRSRMQDIKTYYQNDITPCGDNITMIPQISTTPNALVAFPNPASTQITIQSSSAKQQSFTVYSVNGIEILNGTTTGTSTTLDIHSLSEGMYFIRIGEGATMKTLKFIKSVE